jgi:hypothetical protein
MLEASSAQNHTLPGMLSISLSSSTEPEPFSNQAAAYGSISETPILPDGGASEMEDAKDLPAIEAVAVPLQAAIYMTNNCL